VWGYRENKVNSRKPAIGREGLRGCWKLGADSGLRKGGERAVENVACVWRGCLLLPGNLGKLALRDAGIGGT